LTDSAGLSRREAVKRLAKRHHRSARDVYRTLEDAKKSGD
jgi:hypothetical protein